MAKTVEDFLLSVDPQIAYRNTGSGDTHVKDPRTPQLVRKWADFDLDTLKSMGDGIFQKALHMEMDPENCRCFQRHNKRSFPAPPNETALELHLNATVQESVSCALTYAQDGLVKQKIIPYAPGSGIQMTNGNYARHIQGEISEYKPDWAGILKDDVPTDQHEARTTNSKYRDCEAMTYLPGDTKLRYKVNFRKIPEIPTIFDELRDKARSEQSALTQLYTYCYFSECRYGYIITETQLMVLRIRPGSGARDRYNADLRLALKSDGLLEYKIIPYNTKNPSSLSVCMALWWLHLLAAIDNSIQWNYPPLRDMDINQILKGVRQPQRVDSEEYVPPPNSQVVADEPVDKRPPMPKRLWKRKQDSLHNSGRRQSPVISQPKVHLKLSPRILTTEILSTEPEIDLEPLPYPHEKEKSPQSPQPVLLKAK